MYDIALYAITIHEIIIYDITIYAITIYDIISHVITMYDIIIYDLIVYDLIPYDIIIYDITPHDTHDITPHGMTYAKRNAPPHPPPAQKTPQRMFRPHPHTPNDRRGAQKPRTNNCPLRKYTGSHGSHGH